MKDDESGRTYHLTWVGDRKRLEFRAPSTMLDCGSKRVISVSFPLPPHMLRRQPCPDRLAASVVELDEDRAIEPEPRRRPVERHFTVPLEQEAGAHLHWRAVSARTTGAGAAADLLPVSPDRRAIVLHGDSMHRGTDPKTVPTSPKWGRGRFLIRRLSHEGGQLLKCLPCLGNLENETDSSSQYDARPTDSR